MDNEIVSGQRPVEEREMTQGRRYPYREKVIANHMQVIDGVATFAATPSMFVLEALNVVEVASIHSIIITNLADAFTADELYNLFKQMACMNLSTIRLNNCKLRDADLEIIAKALTDATSEHKVRSHRRRAHPLCTRMMHVSFICFLFIGDRWNVGFAGKLSVGCLVYGAGDDSAVLEHLADDSAVGWQPFYCENSADVIPSPTRDISILGICVQFGSFSSSKNRR